MSIGQVSPLCVCSRGSHISVAAAAASAMFILILLQVLLPILLFAYKGDESEEYEYKLNQDYIIGDEDVYDSSSSSTDRKGVTGAPVFLPFCTFSFRD